MTRKFWLSLGLCVALFGCDNDETPAGEDPEMDASTDPEHDASPDDPDASEGEPDAGEADPDMGEPEGGEEDLGTHDIDLGGVDPEDEWTPWRRERPPPRPTQSPRRGWRG